MSPEQAAEPVTCEICGESETDASLLSDCGRCGALYHLNPRSDREGKDCGDVQLGSQELPAIQFLCSRCIEAITEQMQEQGVPTRPAEIGPPPGLVPPALVIPGLGEDFGAPLTPPATSGPGADTSETAPPPLRRRVPRRRFRRIDKD